MDFSIASTLLKEADAGATKMDRNALNNRQRRKSAGQPATFSARIWLRSAKMTEKGSMVWIFFL